jgi:hypothetical protein
MAVGALRERARDPCGPVGNPRGGAREPGRKSPSRSRRTRGGDGYPGLAALIYAVFEVPESGLASTVTFGATGTLLLICFVVAERRSSAPLVPLRVFTTRPVVFPNAAIFLQSMIGLSWLYVLTLYFQEVLGHGPLAAGLLFAP